VPLLIPCQSPAGTERHNDFVFKVVEDNRNCVSGYCLSRHRGDSQQSSHIIAVSIFFHHKTVSLIFHSIYFTSHEVFRALEKKKSVQRAYVMACHLVVVLRSVDQLSALCMAGRFHVGFKEKEVH